MKTYDQCSKSKKSSTKWLLLCMILIFFMTLTTFSLMEVRNLYNDEPSVVRIIMNSFKSSEETELSQSSPSNPNKFVLVNVEKQQDTEELLKTIITQEELKATQPERKAREANNEQKSSNGAKNSYYEEQTPVVVYAKSDQEVPLSYRQPPIAPPKQDSNEEEPLRDDAVESRQEPYYSSDEQGYYGNQEEEEQQQPYYRPPPQQQYYGNDDSREDFSGPYNSGQQQESEEGRSAQNSNYDSYYRQWHYATPPPATAVAGSGATKRISSVNGQENRKLQVTQQNRDPYATYIDDYDYMPPHSLSGSQHMQQYHAGSSTQALQPQQPEEQSQMNLLSVLKTLKTMWDLYQSFAASWNTIAAKHNKEEDLAKQKFKQQQQLRINANKQNKLNNNNRKNQERPTKNPKKTTTTTTTTPSTSTSSMEITVSSEEEPQESETIKNEPRKGYKGDKTNTKDVEGLREKRQTADSTEVAATNDNGEGRYIKGDPLKGYYDFVITEGSYKFWAAFQVGTALLIIYSTFAAIYYSKVNPLVSDYDYTDYLGGARSLSGGDLDFVDDETTAGSAGGEYNNNGQPKTWFDWLPRTGHSLKFILDAIDKLPADHNEATAENYNETVNTNNDKEENKDM